MEHTQDFGCFFTSPI